MFLSNPDLNLLIEKVEQLATTPGQGLMVLVGEKAVLDIPDFIAACNRLDLPVFGGVFPQVIHGRQSCDNGVVVKVFELVAPPLAVPHLSKGELTDIEELDLPYIGPEMMTAMTLVDGLSSGVANFLEQLNNRFGNQLRFIGGGAGSLSLKPAPCVFTNSGFFQDAAVIAAIREPVSLGVRHGWEKLAGPFVATKTRGNTILELNWLNAFTVYRGAVDADSPEPITSDNFFDVAKAYPFGLMREDQEDVVRDPISTGPSGELNCVGEVPSNSVLFILRGRRELLIEAAEKAAQDSLGAPNGFQNQQALVVDCISRTLFLEEDFPNELDAIVQKLQAPSPDLLPEGMLSLGEIASVGHGVLEFFNKTIVVGLFGPSPTIHHAG